MFIIRTLLDKNQYRVDDWEFPWFLDAMYLPRQCDYQMERAKKALIENPCGEDTAKERELLMLDIIHLW